MCKMKKLSIFLNIITAGCATWSEPSRTTEIYTYESNIGQKIVIDLLEGKVIVLGADKAIKSCSDENYNCIISRSPEAPLIYFPRSCSLVEHSPPIQPAALVAEDQIPGNVITYHPLSPKFLVEYREKSGVEAIYYDFDGEGQFSRLTAWRLDDISYIEKYKFKPLGNRLFSCAK